MKIKSFARTGLCGFLLATAFLANAQETTKSAVKPYLLKQIGSDTVKKAANKDNADTTKAKTLSVKGYKVFKNEKGEVLDTQVAIKMLLGNTYIAIRKVDKDGKEYISVEEPPIED